ncbi:MAG: dihydrodipicolinate synthase family protein [Pyrodictiaceae archaeon]
MSAWLKGVIVASLTPFTENLEIDTKAVAWLFERFVEAGIQGAFIAGTTGEWPMLKPTDRERLANTVLETVNGRLKILLGVSGLSYDDTLTNARILKNVDVDGYVATPPLYFKPSREKMREYYLKLADELDKPLVLYTIPSRVGYNLPADLVAELAQEHSLIAGIKATVPDLHYLHELIANVKSIRPDFSVLAGYGEYLVDSLVAGGDGAVDALSNLVPKLTAEIYKAWCESRYNDVFKLHAALARLATLLRSIKPIQSLMKGVLSSLGAPVKPVVRPPLALVSPKDIALVSTILCTAYREYLIYPDKC